MTTITARRQLRLAAFDALQNIAGVDWESPGEWDVPPRKLPAGRLRVVSDGKAAAAKAAPIFNTTVVLEVQLYVSGTDDALTQDALESLAEQVEGLIFGWTPLVQLVSKFANVQSDVAISTQGNRPVGIVDIKIACETVETFAPFEQPVDLRELGLHLDFQNVAVDRTATYPSPAFPDSVKPAPRKSGPDGRDEGYAVWDMTTGGTPQPIPRLRVSGKDILGPNDQPVLLRGWNWGFWGAAQSFDAVDNVAQGANCVRIPIRWWGLYTDPTFEARNDAYPGNMDPAHLAFLDSVIAQASAAGLWIDLFIDSQCGQNGLTPGLFGQPESVYCDPQQQYPNGRSFWADPTQKAKFIETWQFIAARYKDVPYMGMFEPIVEPNPVGANGLPVPDLQITAFYNDVMTAIRLVAPGIPFLIGGHSYFTNKIGKAWNKHFTDVIYTADCFVPLEAGTPDQIVAQLDVKIAEGTTLRDTKNVPVFFQQVGVTTHDDPDQTYTNALLTKLNAAGIGWEWWEYRESDHGGGGGFGVKYPDGQGGWLTKDALLATITSYLNA
jgi:hypothetical protein